MRFEDGTTMRLYPQTVQDFGLYPGMELTEEEFKKLREAAGKMSAKMRSVRIVSASAVSKGELERRLMQKGESAKDAREAVAWMEELDLLDDRKTAEQIVHRCISKGYGLARAKQVLFEKRIPKVYWEEVLADYPDQTEKLADFLRGRLGDSPDDRAIRKAVDAAMRRGHSYSEIRSAMELLHAELDEFPED